jgi:ankyrin repeat protein
LISASELSKHLTTSHRPKYYATNNGDRPCLLRTLISAPELSKHLTIAQCSRCDATNNGDCPPSSLASKRGHYDIVKCLLSYGADINWRDEGGRSPLFAASHYGHCDVVKCLLSYVHALMLHTMVIVLVC